ncbi:putative S-adenosylmethionine-dependent methyltransferase CRG1 [Hyphodiscus hymeniophilus]|uniref:S-adenosylmethionine-dependent methyltransferase CRG1 n=1 Tax=Hyphodiscus hymeniophilus TaxID=353542 RepID=A0A9P6VNT7_9HELO|nr:putative S-adenosylmethionine-dependent methyltransferase CRG1 [Hyphodiscus hymeniophilus]
MASTTPKDPTFRSYSAQEAKAYATKRLSYETEIYDTVLTYHSDTGGRFGLLLDVGCGPGNATRDVAHSFDHAIGVDPGAAMIDAARELSGKTKMGNEILYKVSPAEEISSVEELKEGSVDLLIAAMAAHWFDMDKFWAEAAWVVKPGGTVALFTCYPDTPNYAKVQEIHLRLERETLGPYAQPGNIISMNMYDDLPLPWTVSTPVEAFPKSEFVKHEYDRDGVLSNGVSFFSGDSTETLDEAEQGMGTASMVTRWRAAHPELVGTDKDVVKAYVNELRDALPKDHQKLTTGTATAILFFKKAAN